MTALQHFDDNTTKQKKVAVGKEVKKNRENKLFYFVVIFQIEWRESKGTISGAQIIFEKCCKFLHKFHF